MSEEQEPFDPVARANFGEGARRTVTKAFDAPSAIPSPLEAIESARKEARADFPHRLCGGRQMTREQELVALIDEAEALLRIARSGCNRTVRDQGSNVRLPSEARMFALHFSPEGRDGPAPLEVRGNGAVYSWFRKVNQTLRKHMLAKDDMLAMLEQRARVADNISAALRLIKQGYAAHAEAVLNETLDMMKENGK